MNWSVNYRQYILQGTDVHGRKPHKQQPSKLMEWDSASFRPVLKG